MGKKYIDTEMVDLYKFIEKNINVFTAKTILLLRNIYRIRVHRTIDSNGHHSFGFHSWFNDYLSELMSLIRFNASSSQIIIFLYECLWNEQPELKSFPYIGFAPANNKQVKYKEAIKTYAIEYEPAKRLKELTEFWYELNLEVKLRLEDGEIVDCHAFWKIFMEKLLLRPIVKFKDEPFLPGQIAIRDYKIHKLEKELELLKSGDDDAEVNPKQQTKKKGRPAAKPVLETFSLYKKMKKELDGKEPKDQKKVLEQYVKDGVLTELPKYPALKDVGLITCCKRAWYDD